MLLGTHGNCKIIADALDVYTYNVETDQQWNAPSNPVAWAFLVGSYADGAKLIATIGQVRFGGRPLQAQWMHDSCPDL